MTVGTGIGLIVIGAILAFAIPDVDFVNLDLIGYILMGAGVVAFIIGLIVLFRRRQSVSETHVATDPVTGTATRRSVTESDDAPIV